MYAIFVTINVKPQYVQQFTEASFGDARGSVRDEPGCFRFDILKDAQNAARFYLYEVYRDEAAFQAHLETPHFKTWKSAVDEMIDGPFEKVEMATVFPSDPGWERQKTTLASDA